MALELYAPPTPLPSPTKGADILFQANVVKKIGLQSLMLQSRNMEYTWEEQASAFLLLCTLCGRIYIPGDYKQIRNHLFYLSLSHRVKLYFRHNKQEY